MTTVERLSAAVSGLPGLDMAAWGADGPLDGLIHHADHGSNYMSMVYTDRGRRAWRNTLDGNRRGLV